MGWSGHFGKIKQDGTVSHAPRDIKWPDAFSNGEVTGSKWGEYLTGGLMPTRALESIRWWLKEGIRSEGIYTCDACGHEGANGVTFTGKLSVHDAKQLIAALEIAVKHNFWFSGGY